MQSVILPRKPTPPTPKLPEFSPKPPIPKLPSKTTPKLPDPKFTDAHLNNLCKNGRLNEAVEVLESIAQRASKVRPKTFARLIQSCIDSQSLHIGSKLHQTIKHYVKNVDPFVETKLIGMYAKCGSLENAYKVFDEMRERDLYTWSAIIGAFSRERKWSDVVELFYMMMKDGVIVDEFLVPKVLQACANRGDVETGKLIHSIVIRTGMIGEIRIANSILAVYAKCGQLDTATRLFENMDFRDRVSWNAVITGYSQKGDPEEAQRLFELMREEGVKPGLVTWNILVSSYNQLGKCDVAMEMMDEMERQRITPDVFTWTSMISGFVQNNRKTQALELFADMVLSGVEPNEVTLMSGVSACSALKDVRKGRELHSVAVKVGLIEDVLVGNSLIDMYSKCGKLDVAQQVFDLISVKDVYTWNSMIAGYCQAGYCGKAHDLFVQMQESNVSPNVITWNAMITGYIHNGDEDQAMDLFQSMEKGKVKRDHASWNALIAGYLQNGLKDKALRIFQQMLSFRVKPNPITILSILPACANLIAAKKVKEIHCYVLRLGLESNLSVGNSLIDIYAKSGNIKYSKSVFEKMSTKDIITWNSLINGYVFHGCSREAIELFDQMMKAGLKPNRSTFVSMISAYGLAKMVEEGQHMFTTMIEEYNILPCVDHYEAMVTLFGRSGKLDEAIEMIDNMGSEPDSRIWAALLTASRIHGNLKLAVHAGEQLLKLEPTNTVIHRLLLQSYELCGIAEGSATQKKPSQRNAPQESLGWSWIEYNNIVHTFAAGHQQLKNGEVLYSWIKSIGEKTRALNHSDELCIEEEENEEIGGIHSEKLALAFILTSSRKSQTIRIMKNLRICGDCHRTAKFISKTYGCEIYLNDSKCLHHFRDGQCSCGDYW